MGPKLVAGSEKQRGLASSLPFRLRTLYTPQGQLRRQASEVDLGDLGVDVGGDGRRVVHPSSVKPGGDSGVSTPVWEGFVGCPGLLRSLGEFGSSGLFSCICGSPRFFLFPGILSFFGFFLESQPFAALGFVLFVGGPPLTLVAFGVGQPLPLVALAVCLHERQLTVLQRRGSGSLP